MPDPETRRLALSCLLLSYVGERPPSWLLDALADGLGGVVLFAANLGDGRDVRRVTDRLREAAGRDVIVALDEEGGDVTRLDTVRGSAFAGAAALGQLDDVATTEEVYAAIGARLAEAGVTLDLAPVADVNVDPRNPVIGLRSFGSDPELVARHVKAAVRGVQRSEIAACAKHFPGHGATTADSHHETVTLNRSRAELDAVEFVPFRAAIAGGVRAIMTGHLVAPVLDDHVATVSRAVTTDVLRGELGFGGAIVTDALEMTAMTGAAGPLDAFVAALVAGADVVEAGAREYPELVEDVPRAVEKALRQGKLSEERLREASVRAGALGRPGRPVEYESALVDGAATAGPRSSRASARAPAAADRRMPSARGDGRRGTAVVARRRAGPPGRGRRDSSGQGRTQDAAVVEIAARAVGRALVVVVRDPARHRWQQPWIGLARAHPCAVVVDAGWPEETLADVPVIRTRGIAPGLIAACADVLTETGLRR